MRCIMWCGALCGGLLVKFDSCLVQQCTLVWLTRNTKSHIEIVSYADGPSGPWSVLGFPYCIQFQWFVNAMPITLLRSFGRQYQYLRMNWEVEVILRGRHHNQKSNVAVVQGTKAPSSWPEERRRWRERDRKKGYTLNHKILWCMTLLGSE